MFAGAGASKAVNPKKFPTTVEFFDLIPEKIQGNEYFQIATQYLKTVQGVNVIDIEMVLWSLQQLREDFSSISAVRSITGYAFATDFVNQVVSGGNVGHIQQISTTIVAQVDALMGQINGLVYNLYNYEPSKTELESNWLSLISNLEGSGDSLEIVTTNYDIAIETALDILNGPVTAREWRGISGRIRHRLNLDAWIGKREHSGRLTKLHGSLDWKRDGDDIYVGDSVFTGDHKKQVIIYPGFKGGDFDNQFSALHNYFSDVLYESTVVVFIGFAFRDEYINNIIRSALNPQSQVYIINPDTSIKFPTSRGRIKQIDGYFDESSIAKIKI